MTEPPLQNGAAQPHEAPSKPQKGPPKDERTPLSRQAVNGLQRKERLEFMGLRGWYLASLVLVYFMSTATNLITYILKPILLLYTNAQGWTTATDTKFYTGIMVTTAMLPILLNPIVTKWTDSRSPKEVFVVIPLLCAIGLALMLVQNKWFYFVGITLTSGILSLRAARQAWILGAVPVAHTSRAMLVLVVSFPIGSLLGPVTAIGISKLWPGEDYRMVLGIGPYSVVVDQYTMVYAFCLAMMSLQVLLVAAIFKDACQDDSASVISSLYYYAEPTKDGNASFSSAPGGGSFASGRSQSICVTYNKSVMCPYGTDDEMRSTEQSVGPQDEEVPKPKARLSTGRLAPKAALPAGAKRAPMWEDWVSEVDHHGQVVRVHSRQYTTRIFVYFGIWTFLINLTSGVFGQILNPVLVNSFELKFTAVSMVTTLHKVCALVASLCAIPLAKHGRDVNLMVVGLALQLLGIVFFCWVPMHLHLVIAGSALLEQGTTFSLAMAVALMSKLLGRRAQGWAFGVFSSFLMLGKGMSTVVGGWVLQGNTIGTWGLSVWGIPTFLVLLMLVHPNMQRFLNPERPLVKRMTNPEPPSVTADENETVLVEITPERQCTIM
eukprot:EG_transcript_4477